MSKPSHQILNALLLAFLLLVPMLPRAGESEWKAHMAAGASAYRAGDYRAATSRFNAALQEAESFGAYDPRLATSLNNLAAMYSSQGRYRDAEPLYLRSLGIREKALGPDHPDVAIALKNLAELFNKQGRYADAEPLVRRSLGIVEKALGPDHHQVATSLIILASIFENQGRYADAELLLRRSLGILEKALGPDHPDVATSLNNLATIYAKQGRYAEAEPPLRRSLGIREKALGPDHPDVATSLINLAEIFKIRGRYANAEPLYRRSLGILEKNLGPDHPTIATAASDLGWMYLMQGRYADAELPLRRSLTIREKALGPDHPKVATSLGSLAWLYRLQRKIDDALVLTRRMSSLLASHFTVDREAASRGALAEQATRSGYFEFHVSLLAQAMQRTPQMRADATQEGFSIAQLARASSTADQVAKMAARYAAGSDALAKLARERQDALAKLEQLDSQIIRTAGQRGKETLAATLRGEEAEVTKKIAALDARLEREYPQYRELTNPKPLELAAAQKLLANDEALVLMLVSRNESFVWALRRNDAGFFKLAIKRAELVEIVKKLRKQLDLGAEDLSQILSKPFDTALAYELYHKILGPAEPLLAGVQHLIAVPDGALTSLPLGVLVTEPPTGSTDGPSGGAMPNSTRNLGVERAAAPSRQTATASVGIGTTAWLAKKTAITVLPAVSSLKALRQFASAPAGGEAFSGFGDPALEGSRGDRRQLNQAVLFSRGAIADVTEVRKIEPLPETAGELRAIARALNAPESALHFRQDATERAVKQGNLARFRNLAFATHGIMSGEFKGLAEPALVLTPPEKGSDLDDGLLTASEISQLKLDADWVVLSACNTAASDGTPGAEGLSGLARAFFYAGARSLLVSHWAVGSDAAVAITTRMFAEYAKGVSKSEALRRSLLAMMERRDNSQFAHPAFWAPFVLVGEGNTDWKK